MILNLKTARLFSCMTFGSTMVHHHTKFGNKIFCGSEDIVLTDFVQWCDDNFLELNVGNTKEMIIDSRQNRTQPNSVVKKGVQVERESTCSYLRVVLTEKETQTPS